MCFLEFSCRSTFVSILLNKMYFSDNGKEILSMNEVLKFLLKNSGPLIQPEDLAQLLNMSQYQWQNYADQLKGRFFSLSFLAEAFCV